MSGMKNFSALVSSLLVMEHRKTEAEAAELVRRHTDVITRGIMHGGPGMSSVRVTALAILEAERVSPPPAVEGKYGEITASHKEFHPGEPVFLLRATDPDAPATVRDYAARCVKRGCSAEHTEACYADAARIEHWQRANPHLVKARAD